MTNTITKALFCMLFCVAAVVAADKNVFDFTLNSIDGQSTPLASFKGKVVMLVNVASRCGFVIVGIPANNFGKQEPGTNQEIKTFCTTKYKVSFPMMSKVSVKGDDITPLYQFLTDKSSGPKTGGEIQWNFTKFLVGPDGRVITRFEPEVTPDSPEVIAAIEKALNDLKR
jgi:glutathione peroxidase